MMVVETFVSSGHFFGSYIHLENLDECLSRDNAPTFSAKRYILDKSGMQVNWFRSPAYGMYQALADAICRRPLADAN